MKEIFEKKAQGFSFLEVLIVIVLVAIVVCFTVLSIMKYLPRYRLEAAAENISSALKEAKYKAVSENNNFVIEFYVSSSSWNVFDDDDNDGVHDAGEKRTYRVPKLLPAGIEYKKPPDVYFTEPDPVTFDIGGAGCDCASFEPSGLLILADPPEDPHAVYLGNNIDEYMRISSNKGGVVVIERWDEFNVSWKEK